MASSDNEHWSFFPDDPLKEVDLKPRKPLLPQLAHTRAAGVAFYCVVCFAFYLKLPYAKQAFLFVLPALSYVSQDRTYLIISASFFVVVFACLMYQRLRPLPCYLVDFCCTKGDERSKASVENFGRFMHTWRTVTDANLKFQFKVFLRSGVGEEATAPLTLFHKGEDVDMQDARTESEDLIFDAARQVLQKTAVDPKEVDIVIVNSSLFNPVPSLTAYLVNMLGMRSNVRSYNLAGMGCSGSLLAIDLAQRLLKVHSNVYALVVSTENITENMYFGNDRSMMISNCLFRCGCAAILLTNKNSLRSHAKLKLLHCLRTNLATDDKAFACVTHKEDSEGKLGVSLQASLLDVAATALRINITTLAPLILPWSELIKVALSLVRKRISNKSARRYEPDFKKAIDHFCIHPGGRAVIDSIGKGLKLADADIEPGRMALKRFGNTSSSGIWYALAYCEAKGRLKKGSKVWQIALGSGFKCNSGVWLVLRDISPIENTVCNPWLDCIGRYPILEHDGNNRIQHLLNDFESLFNRPGQKSDQNEN